jgi:hypothetical protein
VSGLVLLVGSNAVVFQASAKYWFTFNQERTQIQAAAYLISKGYRSSGPFPAGSHYCDVSCLSQDDLSMRALTAWIRHGKFPIPTAVRHDALLAERSILGVFASPTRGYAGSSTFSEPGATTCTTVNPRRSVVVHLLSSGSLRLRIARADTTALTVSLLHIPGAPSTPLRIPVSEADKWLNIPAGMYRDAAISAFSTLRVCVAPTR